MNIFSGILYMKKLAADENQRFQSLTKALDKVITEKYRSKKMPSLKDQLFELKARRI